MNVLEFTRTTLEENLEQDRVTAESVDQGLQGESLRFWEWTDFAVVMGAGGKEDIDVNSERCLAEGVPILRRKSGGGTVLLGSGCLIFSLVLRYERAPQLRDVNASYRWILGRISKCLSVFAPVEMAGICDLVTAEKKFSGNAQHRKRNSVLHHGTILYQFPLEQMERYLNMPERQPEYRKGRPHSDFVTNFPATRSQIIEALANEFADLQFSQPANSGEDSSS